MLDVEMLTVTYGDISSLVKDLRSVGATNFRAQRTRGLTTPGRWQQFVAQLDAQRDTDNRLPVSMEIVTAQAWLGEPDAGVQMEDGEAHFPLSRLLKP